MDHNRLHHRNTFSDVWAILRQPSTAWITRQLLPYIQATDQRPECMEKKTEKGDHGVLKVRCW
jgi:hypothetical protein